MGRQPVLGGINEYQIEFNKPGEKIIGGHPTARTDDIAMIKKTLKNKLNYNDRKSHTIKNVIRKKVLFFYKVFTRRLRFPFSWLFKLTYERFSMVK